MNSKKGFTLIELLAVIVILAIIALIATPTVLNIINNSKQEAIIATSRNYVDAVDNAIAKSLVFNSKENYDGTYIVSNEGKTLTNMSDPSKVLTIEFENDGISEGKITIEHNKTKTILNGKTNDQYIWYDGNRIDVFPVPIPTPTIPVRPPNDR